MASKAKKKGAEPENEGVDGLLDRLEAVVGSLEEGELPLEEALAKFEEGVSLARQGSEMLAAVEAKVERLMEDGESTVPFAAGEESSS